MKTSLRITIIGVTCLVLGGIIGFFAAGRITKNRIHKKVEMQQPPKFKSRLEEKLALTPEQQEQFDSVFMAHMDRMKALDQDMFAHRKAEINQLFKELKKDLNEQQVKTIEKFESRFKSRKHRQKPPPPPRRME